MSGEGFNNSAFLVEQVTVSLEGSNLTEIILLVLDDFEEFIQAFKFFLPQASGHAVLGELSGVISSGGNDNEQNL